MKFLTSPWGLGLLGLILNVGTTAGLLLSFKGASPLPALAARQKTAAERPPWNFKTAEVDNLVAELKAEREKVAAREKEAAQTFTQIEAERQELDKTRAEISGLRDEIARRVVEIQQSELKNLKSLSNSYSSLAAPAAVAIFREMDETMTVKILALMKPDKVGPILGEMAKAPGVEGEATMAKRAAQISDKLRLLKPLPKPNS